MKKIVFSLMCLLLIPILTNAESVTFSACVDGDTAKFIVSNKEVTFRFLAINTPESTNKIEPYGKLASFYTCNKLKNAKEINIEYDDNSDEKDKYGRSLGWIFIDGQLLQKDIVRNGYAKVAYLYGDYKYTDDLKEAEKLAKEEKLNIWSDGEEEDNTLKYILLVVIIIILSIFCKGFRKKSINKGKSLLRKKLNQELKKMDF